MAQTKERLSTIGKITVNIKAAAEYFKSAEGLEEMITKIAPPEPDGNGYKWGEFSKYFDEPKDMYGDEDKSRPSYLLINQHWEKLHSIKGKMSDFIFDVAELLDEYTFDITKETELAYGILLPADGSEYYLFPKHLVLKVNLYETFSDIAIEEVLALKTTESVEDKEIKNALANVGGRSKNEIQTAIESRKKQLADKEAELKNQIQIFEEEMREKISLMKYEMSKVMKPVIMEVETLTDKLYLFESQVYSVLSFLGFTFEIEQIAKGSRAKLDEPLVVWQKLRYLDEELPKLETIYEVEFSDRKLFEKLIVENEVVRDYFLPNEKTITVLKVSKSGHHYSYESKQRAHVQGDKFVWTDFVLEAHELLHGHRSALLIRDGENIYVAWTDDDKIRVNDDNLFYTEQTADVEEVTYDYKEERDVEKYNDSSKGDVAMDNIDTVRQNFKERRSKTKKPMSRIYLKSIIEGLLERGDILRLPEKEDIGAAIAGKGKYIKFRSADLYLKDTTYGTMEDLLEISQKNNPRWNDDIYITKLDNGEDRGRGYVNRTHDAYLKLGLHKINLVEYIWTFYMTKPITEDMIELVPAANKHGRDKWELTEEAEARYAYRSSDVVHTKKYDAEGRRLDEGNKLYWKDAYFRHEAHSITNYSPNVPELEEKLILKKLNDSCYIKGEVKEEIPNRYGGGSWTRTRSVYASYEEAGFAWDLDKTRCDRHVYVSAKKEYSYSESNANLELEQHEYINLTYWNTVWLTYAIRNHHTFKQMFRGDYATQLPHMQEMVRFLKKREDEFVHLIYKHYEGTLPNDWPVLLSHWMSEKDYNNFSEFRAKQFVKYLRNNGK